MFKKNTAITGFSFGLVSATDGSDITTGTPVGFSTLDGGTQTAINDVTPVNNGNGQWSLDLTAAEMNGDLVGLTFTHASAITVHFTIKTDTKIISELNDIAATAIVTAGAINTLSGAIVNVDLVDTCTTNTDMRGTNGSNVVVPDNTSIAAILVDTDELQIDWTNGGRLDLLLDQLITQIDTAASEPAQGAPPVSAKMALKIDYLYKWSRNRSTSTATNINMFADDAATVDHKMTHNDDGTTYDKGEIVTGP